MQRLCENSARLHSASTRLEEMLRYLPQQQLAQQKTGCSAHSSAAVAALAKTDAVPSVQPSLLRVVSFPEAASMFLPLIRYIYSAMRESETHGSTCRPQVILQPCLHTVNQD